MVILAIALFWQNQKLQDKLDEALSKDIKTDFDKCIEELEGKPHPYSRQRVKPIMDRQEAVVVCLGTRDQSKR